MKEYLCIHIFTRYSTAVARISRYSSLLTTLLLFTVVKPSTYTRVANVEKRWWRATSFTPDATTWPEWRRRGVRRPWTPSETAVRETCRCRPSTHEGVATATTFSTLVFSLSWCVLSAGWCASYTRPSLVFSLLRSRHCFSARCFLIGKTRTRVIFIEPRARQIVVTSVQRSHAEEGGRSQWGYRGFSGKPANSVVSLFPCEHEAFRSVRSRLDFAACFNPEDESGWTRRKRGTERVVHGADLIVAATVCSGHASGETPYRGPMNVTGSWLDAEGR